MFVAAPHLIFLLGIVGVSLANQSLSFPAVLLPAYGIGLYHTYRRGRSIRKITETVLAVLAVGLSLLYSGFQGLHYLFSLQYWLALMLVIRSFRRMEKRDYGFCFLISAALFAHVARTYDDLPFLFLTLAALVLAPYALFHFLAHYGGFRKIDTIQPQLRIRFSAAQFRFMTGISAALFLTSVALFLIMPRAGGNSMLGSIAENRDRRASGFSDSVSLGSFSEVAQRRTIVMTVESEQPALWRGGVLDYYEAGVWYGAARYQQRQPGYTPSTSGNSGTATRRFEIFDVRSTGLRLLSAGTIVSLKPLTEGWKIRINDMYSTIMISHIGTVENYHGRYEIVSQASEYVGPSDLHERQWPVPTAPTKWIDEHDLFLQIPADLSDRTKKLALDITRGLNSTEDKVGAVQRYLSDGFRYTLKGLNSGNMQALDYFLFQAKAGHCEYFASAMAILLRCAGVPTRVVQGFAPGTLVDGKYVVRLSDAHLWTEVFYPGKGWRSYDPTPGQDNRLRRGEPMTLLEKLKLRWQSYVLNYDRGRQVALFNGLNTVVVRAVKALKDRMPPLGFSLVALPALCLVLLLIRFRGWRPWLGRPFWRLGHTRPSVSRVRNYFGQYLKEIARKGYRRGPATTPNDLLAALQHDRAPILDEASFLTRLFYETRFGSGKLSPDLEKETQRAVRRIRDWSR